MTFQQPPYPPPAQPPEQGPYGPPGYPGGYPPPPSPYGQAHPPPPASLGTNGFAIASLIFGVLGGVLLSVIFGIIALTQIKRRGQSGRGMAIAGLVLSAAWTLVIVAAIVVAVVADDGSVRATSLSVGDCIESIPGDNARVLTLPKVACAKPHEGEVYAQFRVTTSNFPGQSTLESDYRERCLAAFAAYAPKAADDEGYESYVLYPTQETWDQGDREVVCIATTKQQRTGSIKG
ncbi:DUF4190 domain-containing protein [Mycobacterium simiae]|uniref:DUF4190 domain-containing protein n=1 Tax=Mycobacterium simiae TaxID=1784 RepID=A0A5B1BX40_MYCSI|nr:DUF4190 domain-containing protein [Mycobacterium simiae]KAA1251724.1 DUF4190 domain-containing protein [Mycobacterium simiae]